MAWGQNKELWDKRRPLEKEEVWMAINEEKLLFQWPLRKKKKSPSLNGKLSRLSPVARVRSVNKTPLNSGCVEGRRLDWFTLLAVAAYKKKTAWSSAMDQEETCSVWQHEGVHLSWQGSTMLHSFLPLLVSQQFPMNQCVKSYTLDDNQAAFGPTTVSKAPILWWLSFQIFLSCGYVKTFFYILQSARKSIKNWN